MPRQSKPITDEMRDSVPDRVKGRYPNGMTDIQIRRYLTQKKYRQTKTLTPTEQYFKTMGYVYNKQTQRWTKPKRKTATRQAFLAAAEEGRRRRLASAATRIQQGWRRRDPRLTIHRINDDTTYSEGIQNDGGTLILWSTTSAYNGGDAFTDETLVDGDDNARLKRAFRAMRPMTNYVLSITLFDQDVFDGEEMNGWQEGDDVNEKGSYVLAYNRNIPDTYTKNHSTLFNHNFTSADVLNERILDHLVYVDGFLRSNGSHSSLVRYEFRPIPRAPVTGTLPVRENSDMNCGMYYAGCHYPKQQKECFKWGIAMRENDTEEIRHFKDAVNALGHRYTFTNLDGDITEVVKSRRCGGRNLVMTYHDGHIFPHKLKFAPVRSRIEVMDIHEALIAEQQQCMRLHFGEEGNWDSLWAYRTYDGKVVTAEILRWSQRNIMRKYDIPEKILEDMPLAKPEGLLYKHWVNTNEFIPTKVINDEIKLSTLECVYWGEETPHGVSTPWSSQYEHLDRNFSFNSVLYPDNNAYEWGQKYKVPQSCHKYVHEPPLEVVLAVSGYVIIDFVPTFHHPWFLQLIRVHESTKGNRYPTSFIAFCVERGCIKIQKIYKLMWGDVRTCTFPSDEHHINRRLIGKTWQDRNTQTTYFANEKHRDHYINHLRERDLLDGWTDNSVSKRVDAKNQYLEVRCWFMGLQAISMLDIVLRYGDNLACVRVDDIWIRKGTFKEPITPPEELSCRIPGQWKREKGTPYRYENHYALQPANPPSTPWCGRYATTTV